MTRRALLQLGMMGSYPLPRVVRMDGACPPPGFVLGIGEVTAAQHESDEGYFALGQAKAIGVVVMPKTPAWHRLLSLRGNECELVIRRYER